MLELLCDCLIDALLDTLRLVPFLFLTYLVMEALERRTQERSGAMIRFERAGALGPVLGALLGIVPQCGFSAAASSLYAGGLISLGTLLAVFLSTSDEMLPLLISSQVPVAVMGQILLAKAGIGLVTGLVIDFVLRRLRPAPRMRAGQHRGPDGRTSSAGRPGGTSSRETESAADALPSHPAAAAKASDPAAAQTSGSTRASAAAHPRTHHHESGFSPAAALQLEPKRIHDLCEEEHCGCEEDEGSVLRAALVHTLHIALFVLLITLALDLIVEGFGEEVLRSLLVGRPVLGVFLAAAAGLVPNCASSILITQLYLDGLIAAGQMMAGLLVSAGAGLLVLFRTNDRHPRENVIIAALLYALGVLWGLLLTAAGLRFL